ncbi:MAG TPA: cysteine desulfurase family protein [Vicinamibacterales bacterium]|nr:cysteine desulfurase family protein [Vicinamibacterales bacterium]
MHPYLDYNSTTPVDGRVLEKMLPWFLEQYGNPASLDHRFGWDAAEAVEQARSYVAELIEASAEEIVFTSSATESINCALRGIAADRRGRIAITAATEHEAVLETCDLLSAEVRIKNLATDGAGRVAPDGVALNTRRGETGFVCLMLANNEIGTIHPLRQYADVAHDAGALLVSDLTQAVGKIPIDVRSLGLDLAAFSAHKLYGPKGVGALFIRGGEADLRVRPLIVGGRQERGFRAGTLNVPGIIGFGEACRIAKQEMADEAERLRRQRDRLETSVFGALRDVWISGDRENRLSNTSNCGFKGVDARTMIRDMHDIAVSTRSACSSGSRGPSHVLKAIGLTDEDAYSCIRFSLGRFTTEDEIDYTIEKVVASAHKLRRNKGLRR